MAKAKEYKKMIAELKDLREKATKKIASAKAAIESELGLDIKFSTHQEYNDNDYYNDVHIDSVGGIECGFQSYNIQEMEIERVEDGLKKIKKNPDAKEEVIENLSTELYDDGAAALLEICLKSKKSPSDVCELLSDYIDLCECEG